MSTCTFGKWVEKDGDLTGRHMKQLQDGVIMKKDILENSASCWAGPRASIRSRWSRQSETGSFATLVTS